MNEEVHRIEQLLEVVTAIEINLKGFHPRRPAVSSNVRGDLFGCALASGPLAVRRSVACDGAEVHAKTHTGRWYVLAPDLGAGLSQVGLVFDEVR